MPSLRKQRPREQARKARTDLYRQHILDAAERVFAERGFEAAKVQDICTQVGLSMGTLYALFPSKSDLYLALIESRGSGILELVRGVAAHGSGPRDGLKALIDAYVGFFVDHPDFLRMHLRAGTSWVLSPSAESEKRNKLWKDIHALQADIFRRGVEAGAFIDEDPAYLARMFSAMDQVLLADWVENGMKATRAALVSRLQGFVERAFYR
jgi:AcrR family transcriptional regulator